MKMYTCHDAASKAYLPPFTVPSERDAVASFQSAAQDPQSNICKYPGDFTLIHIGEFDERTGVLIIQEPQKIVMTGTQAVKKNDSV